MYEQIEIDTERKISGKREIDVWQIDEKVERQTDRQRWRERERETEND